MNILHYSLGLPPFRGGGMTKYCMDLMKAQVKKGHSVSLLWPGELKDYTSYLNIKEQKNYTFDKEIYIKCFEIKNPLPVPMLNGIKDFNEYTCKKDMDSIKKFLLSNKIDVFHIHTFMGLPKEVVEECKVLGVKVVFTSHDYFGICAKWWLQKDGKPCLNDHECKDCIKCNESAFSLTKVKFLQSNMYRRIKDFRIVKLMRNRHNSKVNSKNILKVKDYGDKSIELAKQYKKLRKYYIDMLEMCNKVHFNSTNTHNIYKRYFDCTNSGRIINISTGSINDCRKIRKSNSPVRIGYLGPIIEHKGYFYLKKVCDEIYKERGNVFELHIFAKCQDKKEYLINHGTYEYKDLPGVMDKFDILVVPSLMNETFGLTVLEAMSYGIPAIVTKHVGAKDIISNRTNGIIIEPTSSDLKNTLNEVISNNELIDKMNQKICEEFVVETMDRHVEKILSMYLEDNEEVSNL